MKTTLDERMTEKMAMEEEKDYLKETVGKLQGQLNQTQGEVEFSFLIISLGVFLIGHA